MRRNRVTAGVPQGSVLGPMLWNLAYDSVIKMRMLKHCRLVCYADDTLLVVQAGDQRSACELANRQLRRLVAAIEGLGLCIVENKTEAVFFSKRGLRGNPEIKIGNLIIKVNNRMRYLEVLLDSRLKFEPHFEFVQDKVAKIVRLLGKLMPI